MKADCGSVEARQLTRGGGRGVDTITATPVKYNAVQSFGSQWTCYFPSSDDDEGICDSRICIKASLVDLNCTGVSFIIDNEHHQPVRYVQAGNTISRDAMPPSLSRPKKNQ